MFSRGGLQGRGNARPEEPASPMRAMLALLSYPPFPITMCVAHRLRCWWTFANSTQDCRSQCAHGSWASAAEGHTLLSSSNYRSIPSYRYPYPSPSPLRASQSPLPWC